LVLAERFIGVFFDDARAAVRVLRLSVVVRLAVVVLRGAM
jgi:hypothetical protein